MPLTKIRSENINASPNLDIDSGTLFVDSVNNRIGVKTSSPSNDLTVDGTAKITGSTVIEVTDNTNAALRITQLGTGNAILVEDSTNPDASPFVVDSNGRIIAGHTSAFSFASGFTPQIQNISSGSGASTIGTARFSADSAGPNFSFFKSRSATVGTVGTVVNANDFIGSILFIGDDGSVGRVSSSINGIVDGTPGLGDMPGALTFATTADGASSPTERMRIDSAGNVGIGTVSPGAKLTVENDRAVNAYGFGLRTFNGASFENSFVMGFNGTVQYLGNFQSFPLVFLTNNTERMRIGADGDVLITSNSLSIGNADTTITRSAAGVIAVEGGVIPKENRTNTFTANQTISVGATTAQLALNADAGQFRNVAFTAGGVGRWTIAATGTAESGSNAGTNFALFRFDDTGAFLGTAISVIRSTGLTTLEALRVNGASVISVTDNTNAALRITQLGTGEAIRVEDSTNPDATPFVVTADGNVGIGTSSPSLPLHVYRASGTSQVLAESVGSTGSDNGAFQAKGGSHSSYFIQYGTGYSTLISFGTELNIVQAGAYPIKLRTNDTERMRINSAGNVGIGTTSPGTSRLAVVGGPMTFDPGSPAPPDSSRYFNFDIAGLNYARLLVPAGSGGALAFHVGTANAAVERMRIDASGNVGIGKTPVNGMLDVNGRVSAATGFSLPNDQPILWGPGDGSVNIRGNASTDLFEVYTAGSARLAIDSAGNVSIGGAGSARTSLAVQKDLTGGSSVYGVSSTGEIQSGVTSGANMFYSEPTTAAASFTVTSLRHYMAAQGSLGAGSALYQQIGFFSSSSLVGATNNYGFHAANTAAVGAGKTAVGFYSEINIATGGGTTWGFFAAGTAPNYFSGDVRSNTVLMQSVVPTNSNSSATVTASGLINGIYTGTPTAGITFTLPTGTNMDGAFENLQTNQAFKWTVINLASATHAITIAQNTGHTVVGNMTVAAATSATFWTRKTGTNTFVTYRAS